MSGHFGKIKVSEDGAVEPDDTSTRVLAEQPGEFDIVVSVPDMLVLRRGKQSPQSHGRILMAGEIVSRTTVMEVVNVIASANWKGELHVFGEEHRRLVIEQGRLSYAASTADGDRLGEVLARAGLIDREELRTILRFTSSTKRFGELCVSRGLFDTATLFENLHKQAEEIFYAALLESDGHYLFELPPEDKEPNPTALHIAVQGLLMEGVQRIDEMALFRSRIPNMQLCPHRNPEAPEPSKLDDTAKAVFELCNGERSIEEISREVSIDEFAATKAVYHLITQKQVILRQSANVDEKSVTTMVNRFNEVMQDIFMAVATYGGLEQTRTTLESWIAGSGYGAYFGAGIDDFGCVDSAGVIAALKQSGAPEPMESLHHALHELASFSLFTATTTLPRDQELSLARDVGARLKTIKT